MQKKGKVSKDTAVWISNLPKNVEFMPSNFHAFISKTVGPVERIIYTNLTSPKSATASAICQFKNVSDFKAAVDILHGQEFSGHHLLVQSFKDSKFDTHHTTKNCVCVSNIDDMTTEEDLWKLFEGCGDLGIIHINRNTATGSAYEAIVNFKFKESVPSAVKLDGSKVLGSTVKVVMLDRKFCVFVTSIAKNVDRHKLQQIFYECSLAYFILTAGPIGPVKSAFVFLANEAGYKQALTLNGRLLEGKPIKIVSAANKFPVESSHVFSRVIPCTVSTEEIKKVYGCFGTVTKVQRRLENNVIRVSYKTEEQAQAAVQASGVGINGAVVSIHPTFNKAFRVIKNLEKKTEKDKALEGPDPKMVEELNVATMKKEIAPEKNESLGRSGPTESKEMDAMNVRVGKETSCRIYLPLPALSVSAREIVSIFGRYGSVTNVQINVQKKICRVSFEAKEQALAAIQASRIEINGFFTTIHPTFKEAFSVMKGKEEALGRTDAEKTSSFAKKMIINLEEADTTTFSGKGLKIALKVELVEGHDECREAPMVRKRKRKDSEALAEKQVKKEARESTDEMDLDG